MTEIIRIMSMLVSIVFKGALFLTFLLFMIRGGRYSENE